MSNILEVPQQQAIQSLIAKGWSVRLIARTLGINRRTVKRYAAGSAPKRTTEVITGSVVTAESKCTTQVTTGSALPDESKCTTQVTTGSAPPDEPKCTTEVTTGSRSLCDGLRRTFLA